MQAVSVHGRTREQGYTGTANYEAIGRVKAAVSIPVIGNGDVVDGESAVRLRAVSGCDGVMLGRGALGNPWIYREVEAALEGADSPPTPGLAERKEVLRHHVELQQQYHRAPIGPLRRIASWYFKECPGAREFRGKINRATSLSEMRHLIDEF